MIQTIALITGSTSGIGKATAKLLAAEGAHVIISGRRAAEGAQTVKEITGAGGEAYFIQVDVSREESVKNLISGIVGKYGRLDWVVNSAGAALESKVLADSDSEVFKTMLDINLSGTYLVMKHAIRQMQRQAGGAIVNVSSTAGVKGTPTFSAYGATKFGVVGMTKTAALEYAQQNIRINAVAPGGVRTEPIVQLIASGQVDEAAIAAMHPMNRIAEPVEIANGIAWLLSDKASFVTGHVLSIDGGANAS